MQHNLVKETIIITLGVVQGIEAALLVAIILEMREVVHVMLIDLEMREVVHVMLIDLDKFKLLNQ